MPSSTPPKSLDRVAIIGAGAMGCLFAARLHEAGASVTLIEADPERVAGLRATGVVIEDDSGSRRVNLRVCTARDVITDVDLIILLTKSLHSRQASRSVAHLARSRPLALTLQNGLGNAEALAEVFGADSVLMGTAHVPADLHPPNRVQSTGHSEVFVGGLTSCAATSAKAVADLLRAGGFNANAAPDIVVRVWEKLAFNAALNAVAMICRASNGQINNDWGLRLANGVLQEVDAVGRACGIELERAKVMTAISRALIDHPHHKASMLQDRERGRSTEIGAINEAIVAAGDSAGIATPTNAALSCLVRLIESCEISGYGMPARTDMA